ncbi:Hypothetical predicted protein [Paramuricea clavata]|uniref:Uncharacterized protein n=1 Tax=Paramuricea clavata TaxID=317549 RepID=A0A7D9DM06_PARCT|nr:Hypothetical predicted protein [Paramuricea clavata]
MTSRGTKKKGKHAEHFGSKSHKAALADFYAFSQESLNVDLLLDKEKCCTHSGPTRDSFQRHCPSLNRWLNEVRLRPYHVTYMSHDLQNEMIDILAENIRDKVKEEVSDSKMFSVMADTTPDTSNKDRLAVAVRYVEEDSPSFAVKERLIEVKETTDKTGNGQASDILTSLEDSGLKSSELVFQ